MADKRWQDWVNLIAGLWLLVAPWAMRTLGDFGSSWNAWILGIVIAVVAIWALMSPQPVAPEWVNVLLGAWTFIAPWVLHFTSLAAAWNAWIVGLVVLIVAAWAIGQMGSKGVSTGA